MLNIVGITVAFYFANAARSILPRSRAFIHEHASEKDREKERGGREREQRVYVFVHTAVVHRAIRGKKQHQC